MELPRLTGTLRAFSGLSAPPTREDVDVEKIFLIKHKELAAEKLCKFGQPWSLLKQALCENDSASTARAKQLMNNFKKVIRNLAGQEAPFDTVDDAAIYVFKLFQSDAVVSQRHISELRQLFGAFEPSLAKSACETVNELVSITPPEILEQFLEESDDLNELEEPYFGKDFLFSQFEPMKFTYDFGDVNLEKKEEFSMKYIKPITPVKQDIDVPSAVQPVEKYNFKWLKDQVLSQFSDSVEILGKQGLDEICMSAYRLLCLDKSDEELQNDLFELLGFDRFELIQLLLQHRQAVVKSAPPRPTLDANGSSRQESRVIDGKSMGIGILVQSEQEKSIRKWARKEERKQQKTVEDDEDEAEFDPQLLRALRESTVMAVASAPIFTPRSTMQVMKYPNVYDSYLDARNMPGFISGVKIMLPPGLERINNNIFESVEIPPAVSGCVGVPKELISVSALDEIGQVAFKGTKCLNRIQSIVFDAAYHTNGNLLICAPTGAGKTNIAMLCVLREIGQHIENGKIQLDKFKIVYVAPMKALAAEMVTNFGKRLSPLGIKVRELTGDMQLTKSEIKETQMLVTTPEKWDVVTRKSTGDVSLALLVKLLIIDEVHLLHGDRGPVLESLVARTLRQVETSQSMIRIIGLSATLPNYVDVAQFLSVDLYTGLFYFDSRFRPVPLGMTFVGIKALNPVQQMKEMDNVCYEKITKLVSKGHQVMVFVHARNATVRTATVLRDFANQYGDSKIFSSEESKDFGIAQKQVMLSRNKQLRELFPYGFAFHHAGMLRQDRNLVERLFSNGLIKVLVCTATLAWGVNLPAHAVIIRGTELYDAKHGSYIDLGILDVMQIFGRAGRPQYDTSGHGTIITTHDKLAHYLSLLTCQYPIESQFVQSLVDNLNAEVALGTVTTLDEAVHWLSYTYLYIRMLKNPLVYGIKYDAVRDDPGLMNERKSLIVEAAKKLDTAHMIRFEESTGYLNCTDLGRTASHFYIKYATVEVFNEILKPVMSDSETMAMLAMSQEFDQLKVRDEELDELDDHLHHTCRLPVPGGSENSHGKVNILIQTFIGQGKLNSFSLISDQAYVMQNATRIIRALFEIVLRKNWPIMAGRLLVLCKVLEHQLWSFSHPLKQFKCLGYEIMEKIERAHLTMDKLKELKADEIGHLVRHVKMGQTVKRCVEEFPCVGLEATIQPITRTVLRVHLSVSPEFNWNDHVHGKNAESFWIWVEDPITNHMYHSEFFLLTKKQVIKHEAQILVFTIPIFEPLPSQYLVRAESDRWIGSCSSCAISFQHLILPERHPPNTDLLDLRPLPVTALQDSNLESLYKFDHFNPIQTQIFHMLYHTDQNVLLGAPTGSGKTIVAEIAMFRVFRNYPKTKVVYIAPLKALVRERIEDWKVRLEKNLNLMVVELTGDVTPDVRAIEAADVIVTTPEKWDGISRSWQTRNYVKSVSLIVIDEIHLLGEDRGPVLEVIVSRTNFISSNTGRKLRVIGLSTALANARDLADWLGIEMAGLYNFRPSVRPVPMEVHIQGFPGKHYCPRMATMNKPVYQAIQSYSPKKPALIFVSSRRQTRLTALDLIAYLAVESNPKQWLNMEEDDMNKIIASVKETNLKLTLSFGIAIHHAGLQERDRKTVEQLFVTGKIQVLIATATLAWGVNFPAHLVVVKGTEYYDGKTRRYVDFPITDVLQMIGRAGRPQFDDHGVAVVLVHDVKKHFYKKFLYEPFPVESSLLNVLHDHLNAELVAGTISSKQDAMDYLTWTYFFRRLLQNPSFYNLKDKKDDCLNSFLSEIIQNTLNVLQQANCVEVGEDNRTLLPTTIGRIASFYYLSHLTVHAFKQKLSPENTLEQLLEILCGAHEYEELPVRHNEDATNSEFAKECPIAVNPFTYDSPHTKAHLLFQAHFGRLQLPCTDYLTDQKSVLDQAIRILQAMVDIVADQGWLATTLTTINLIQMVVQGRWINESALLMLPCIEHYHLHCLMDPINKSLKHVSCLPELMDICQSFEDLAKRLRDDLDDRFIEETFRTLKKLPVIDVRLHVAGLWENGSKTSQQSKPVTVGPFVGRRPESYWIKVHADQEYILNVELVRLNAVQRKDSRAYAPKFSKSKDEGWILVLGISDKKEVIALKRIGLVHARNSIQLIFYTPETVGRVIYTLYLMSDSYLGLDQQYDICLEIIPVNSRTQEFENDNDMVGIPLKR